MKETEGVKVVNTVCDGMHNSIIIKVELLNGEIYNFDMMENANRFILNYERKIKLKRINTTN